MIQAGGKVAGGLFVVAVFMERSLAVVTGLLLGEERRVATAKLIALKPEEDRTAKLEALAVIDAKAEFLRLSLGLLFGLFLSAAGVRTLESLLTFSATGQQLNLLHGVDVLLTGGLLAGGSNGLAAIIEVFKHRLEQTLAQLRMQPAPSSGNT